MTNDQQDAKMNMSEGGSENLAIEWRDVPTIVADSVVGFVTVGGMPRVTLGQISYKPGGVQPKYIPVVTIAAPVEALGFIAAQLQEIASSADRTLGGVQDEQSEG